MKTSISSEAPSQLGAEKIAFPQKPNEQNDSCNYRVASLLKKYPVVYNEIVEIT